MSVQKRKLKNCRLMNPWGQADANDARWNARNVDLLPAVLARVYILLTKALRGFTLSSVVLRPMPPT